MVTITICTIAAMYTPPGFGHSVTMVTKNGGISRHPVLLGLNRSSYVILVTGTVLPPFRGGFRVALEGDQPVSYKILSRYPPELNLRYHHFHQFKDNMVTDIRPFEKFALTVGIKPDVKITERSDYQLKFYDLKSDKTVLTIPVSFMELDNFNISKQARRTYHEPLPACPMHGTAPAIRE